MDAQFVAPQLLFTTTITDDDDTQGETLLVDTSWDVRWLVELRVSVCWGRAEDIQLDLGNLSAAFAASLSKL
jgi:hypothetical protein